MIELAYPARLIGLAPWALMCWLVLRRQLAAASWLEAHTDRRRRSSVMRSSRWSLAARVVAVFAAGAALIVAAAGPYRTELGEQLRETRTVILIFDASLSMGAPDATRSGEGEETVTRINQAAAFARDLIDAVPQETAWSIVSFSGEAVIHSPPTDDRFALDTLLNNMRVHLYSRSSGSRFSAAFETAVHLVGAANGSAHVVLLSDGEISSPDDYDDSLAAVAALGVPVHTVGFGSREWMAMSVWVLEDVIAGAGEKRTAAEYRTRREDASLKRMARRTGGRHLVVERGDWVDDLAPFLEAAVKTERSTRAATRTDQSWWATALAMAIFLVLTVGLPDRRGVRSPLTLVVVILPLSIGCGHPLLRAHRINERGLTELDRGDVASATRSFETAAAFGARAHIPVYNRGNAAMVVGDLVGAHQVYELALRLEPRFAEAHYNDGHALYLWGAAELDEERCELERTRELWQRALTRFEDAAHLAGWGELARAAKADAELIRQKLAELEALAEHCDPPPDSGGGAGGEGGEGGGDAESTPLSTEDQAQVASELERIRQESAGAGGFRQSHTAQIDPEQAAGAGEGRKIWW